VSGGNLHGGLGQGKAMFGHVFGHVRKVPCLKSFVLRGAAIQHSSDLKISFIS
jgi:hypothetical protein